MSSLINKNIFSVSRLTFAIKSHLEPYFRGIYVQGEISNLKRQSSGHIYFSLKDKEAQISAVLFKRNSFNLTRLPQDGDNVIILGEISIYPPRGNYQIIVREISFQGVGELLIELHKRKEKLKALGWFDPSFKKKLPKFPKRIGVITSPTGAVIQDIINVLNRRFYGVNLILNPVKVQGMGAKEEIAQAILDMNKYNLSDVIIIGRGGGSLEDLWAFNEEIVAKAIYQSQIPIISAVGHETDVTIADYVADIRAPTPSAAAEIVSSEKKQLIQTLNGYRCFLDTTVFGEIKRLRQLFNSYLQQPICRSPYQILGKYLQQLDDIKSHFHKHTQFFIEQKKSSINSIKKQINTYYLTIKIKTFKEKLATLKESLHLMMKHLFKIHREKLEKVSSNLKSIDPNNLLKKGYSILFSEKDNSIILSVNHLRENDQFTALLADGKIKATIQNIEKK